MFWKKCFDKSNSNKSPKTRQKTTHCIPIYIYKKSESLLGWKEAKKISKGNFWNLDEFVQDGFNPDGFNLHCFKGTKGMIENWEKVIQAIRKHLWKKFSVNDKGLPSVETLEKHFELEPNTYQNGFIKFKTNIELTLFILKQKASVFSLRKNLLKQKKNGLLASEYASKHLRYLVEKLGDDGDVDGLAFFWKKNEKIVG